jgi:hypothetical protein
MEQGRLIPGWLKRVTAVIAFSAFLAFSNRLEERSHSTSLKTISSAGDYYWANDRDWNRVNDFWTANVILSESDRMTGALTDPDGESPD